jgi:hypothetical protein
VIGGWLLVSRRQLTRGLIAHVALAGVLVGALGAAMSYPYFESRKDFPLIRSEAKAAEYSGTMADLGRVYPNNRTLTFLHDRAEGPLEPISFPGFVLLALVAFALAWPVLGKYRAAESHDERRMIAIGALFGPIAVLSAVGASVVFRDGIAALVAFVATVAIWRALRKDALLPPTVIAYALLVVLAIALFLGPAPVSVGKEPVRGLYYYLYHFVPGFDGVRYVSRLAIIMMLGLGVLGGLGAAMPSCRMKPRRLT